jgi:uncharacterized protein YjlB
MRGAALKWREAANCAGDVVIIPAGTGLVQLD